MIHRHRIYLLIAVLMASISHGQLSAQDISHPIRIPAEFHHGLIFVEPASKDGNTMRFFTDTADITVMYQQTVDRLLLTTTSAIIQDRQMQAAFLPQFDSTRFIPPPLITDGLIPVRPDDRKPPHHRVILGGKNGTSHGDGILGSSWFASRAWSINYRDETFYAVPVSSLMENGFFMPEQNGDEGGGDGRTGNNGDGTIDGIPSGNDDSSGGMNNDQSSATGRLPGNTVPLYFKMEGGRRAYHYPALHVVIAGDTLAMVLKTGSNIILNDSAQKALGHPDALFPAGLISESVADGWMDAHPDWTVYEGADHHYGSDVIKVPEIRIGPHSGGPVRFAIRREEAFSEWFSQFTGIPVVGAIGPDAFRDAHITINYPGSVLIFHDP